MFRSPTILLALLLLPLFIKSCASNGETADDNPSSPSARLDLIADDFTAPVVLISMPGGKGKLIVDQTGEIWLLKNGKVSEEPFLDLSDKIVDLNPFYDERGLLGLTLHPEFASNRKFYVYYSGPLRPGAPSGYDHTSVLSEFTVPAETLEKADPGSERVVMYIDQPQSNHNGGCLAFGPDGYLYIATGDGGAANDIGRGHAEDWYERNDGGNGQNITDNLLGAILRIDTDGDPYSIPSDNPFVGKEGRDEIYAFGLRNPFRFSFDQKSGMLISCDVGQELWEEISVIKKGGNYGWNVKEGSHCFDASDADAPAESCPEQDAFGNPLIDPVIEMKNSKHGGLTVSLIGGYVYRGNDNPELQGKYIYGSWSGQGSVKGKLFMASPSEKGNWDYVELNPSETDFGYLLSFAEDQNNELYILTTENKGPTGNTGKIYKLSVSGLAASFLISKPIRF